MRFAHTSRLPLPSLPFQTPFSGFLSLISVRVTSQRTEPFWWVQRPCFPSLHTPFPFCRTLMSRLSLLGKWVEGDLDRCIYSGNILLSYASRHSEEASLTSRVCVLGIAWVKTMTENRFIMALHLCKGVESPARCCFPLRVFPRSFNGGERRVFFQSLLCTCGGSSRVPQAMQS